MNIDDAANNRQSNACSFTARIEFIEQPEDLLMVLRFDPDAVITYKEERRITRLIDDTDLDIGHTLIIAELYRIINQVLYYFNKPIPVAVHNRHMFSDANARLSFGDPAGQQFERLLHHNVE